MLILHGTRDRNVPIAAALEHHRIVSQSEMFEFDENHFMAFMHPAEFLDPLERFLDGVRQAGTSKPGSIDSLCRFQLSFGIADRTR